MIKITSLIAGTAVLTSFVSVSCFAQTFSGYCEKKSTQPRLEIKQKKAPVFFKTKVGTFCTTPLSTSNGSFITGCDDGLVRIISNAGVLLKTISVDHDKELGVAPNPEVIALPNTNPEQFVVTSMVDRVMIRFDSSGKIISKVNTDSDAGVPVLLSGNDYFMIDWDGVAHFYSDNKETINVDTKSSYPNDPSVRVNGLGENEVIFSDYRGKVYILKNTGAMRVVNVSSSGLSNTKVAPDGKVWVSDSAGVMYVLDVDAKEVKFIKVGGTAKLTRPVFLKNGKVAFGGGDYIYIYDLKNFSKPEVIIDSRMNQKAYALHTVTDYLGTLMEDSDLGVIELEDGSENLWIPTHGGYYFADSQGAVTGVYSYGIAVADAETYSAPRKLKDGTFIIGLFNGVDRMSFRKSSATTPISSSVWIPCDQVN